MENKIIYKCDKCTKKYKSQSGLDKHSLKCKSEIKSPVTDDSTQQSDSGNSVNNNSMKENNYDVNMTFLENNKVKVELKKQYEEASEEGEKVLKEMLKPTVSSSYQDEIDKLDDLISMFKDFPIPEDPNDKDTTISHLKNVVSILMTQSQNIIKEMKTMSKKNSYYKNNIMLAAFILDKCRREIPENDEDFDNMFN